MEIMNQVRNSMKDCSLIEKEQKDLNKKRSEYITWPDYFMAIAFLSAQRSKDPRTQVGACIVNVENKIVGIGYNGMPVGCNDDEMPWGRNPENLLESKQLYVCHAELNAVLNRNSADVKNCTIYVALFPCNECAKVVIQSGIKEVVYYSDKYYDRPEFVASKRMLDKAGVKYRQYIPKQRQITIDFAAIDAMTGTSVEEVLNGN
uniref:dCMP deaminase n=1 Tax=Crassostrea virginica TaxID=6565 RepID=A0A8B8DBZ4_CRAVI|nr:deoxycytidylate deaminase-like [Crassostrea virginica]